MRTFLRCLPIAALFAAAACDRKHPAAGVGMPPANQVGETASAGTPPPTQQGAHGTVPAQPANQHPPTEGTR